MTTIRVAVALLEATSGPMYGYDLCKSTGLRSGVLYPILHRFFDEGWLSDGWEERSQIDGKRPPRRYYELTDVGRKSLGGLVNEAAVMGQFGAIIPTGFA